MKSNGKNYKVFIYESHDYMDMEPEKTICTYASKEDVEALVQHMREHWGSGTVSNAKELSPKELFEQRQSKYWKGYEESIDALVADCPQSYIDEYMSYVEHNI